MPAMETGIVQKWIEYRGFGFIKPSSGGEDLFVHAREIQGENRSLSEGEEVEFNISQEQGRNMAVNVTGPGGAPVRGAAGGGKGWEGGGKGKGMGKGKGGGKGGGKGDGFGVKVFFGNLPFTVRWQDLKDVVRSTGFEDVHVVMHEDWEGRSKGQATVTFNDEYTAAEAIRLLHGYPLFGRQMDVHFDKFA
mmetsp:Transcript_9839/g.17380  ORF Transcript_9839/g.17380 Transcript_9839/m.17380 type:complete len:191 (-) Transcript_9839:992-1564(-)